MTPGTLRRTRIGSGIRAALDRATRQESIGVQQDARPSLMDEQSRIKYRQVGGARDGRWKDLNGRNGRFTAPPSPRDEVITQDQAIQRRASRGASPAAGVRQDGQHGTVRDDSTQRAQRTPTADRNGSRSKKIKDVDRSWEEVTHADANAAEQAAIAASPTATDAAATDVAATVKTAPVDVDNAQADGTNDDDADDKRIQQTGSGAMDDDVEKPLSNESPDSFFSLFSF